MAVSVTAAAVVAAGGILAARFLGRLPSGRRTGDRVSSFVRRDPHRHGQGHGSPLLVPGIPFRLATRPNGATAWVRGPDVTITSTPRIVVDLRARHLELLRAGKVILDTPAAIGTAADPIPAGAYFPAFFEKPVSPGYGPFIIVTSAHSTTIGDWEGSGDALAGIHGPLGGDAAIGTTGARLSHGCIRLHVPALTQLRDLPAGTPLTITP